MLELIGYLMPAFISVSIVLLLDNKERKVYKVICMYFDFCLLVNLFALIITRYIFGITDLQFIVSIALLIKWILLTSFIATVLGILFVIIKKNIAISFELKRVKDEKK